VSTAPKTARKSVNPILVMVRVVVITLAFGILGLGLGGFFGIIGVSIINLAGQPINMYMALFAGALPGAAVGLLVGLVVMIRFERKAMRENKEAA
jgi:hypothetical protein